MKSGKTYNEQELRGWNATEVERIGGDEFGLEFKNGTGKKEMIALILDKQQDLGGGDRSGARADGAETAPGPGGGKAVKAGSERHGKSVREERVTVLFNNQSGPGGSDDIFVSVNGRAYLIKREHEVKLPVEVMSVIEHAEESVFERGADNRLRERLVKRYSYTPIHDPRAKAAA